MVVTDSSRGSKLPDAFAAAIEYLTTTFPDVINQVAAGRPVGNPVAAAYPVDDQEVSDAVMVVADLLPVSGPSTMVVSRGDAVAALRAARADRERSGQRWLLRPDPVLPVGSPADLEWARRIDRIEDPDAEIGALVEAGFFADDLRPQRRAQLVGWKLSRAVDLHDAATARTVYLQHPVRVSAGLRRSPAADEENRPVRLGPFLDPEWQRDAKRMGRWLALVERAVETSVAVSAEGDVTVVVDGITVPVTVERGRDDLIVARVGRPPAEWTPADEPTV
jgi:hypothetical protein